MCEEKKEEKKNNSDDKEWIKGFIASQKLIVNIKNKQRTKLMKHQFKTNSV